MKKTPPKVKPQTDDELGRIPGVPDEAEIVSEIGNLSDKDRRTYLRIKEELAQHLGSYAAARVWLTTQPPGFACTPLEMIAKGQAVVVLRTLRSAWSRSPTYA